MEKRRFKCCICGEMFAGWGNSPWPLVNDENAECCDDCNNLIIMARILNLVRSEESDNSGEDEM